MLYNFFSSTKWLKKLFKKNAALTLKMAYNVDQLNNIFLKNFL
jgi:hypothetical protein